MTKTLTRHLVDHVTNLAVNERMLPFPKEETKQGLPSCHHVKSHDTQKGIDEKGSKVET